MRIGGCAALFRGSLLLSAASLCPLEQATAQARPTDDQLITQAIAAAPTQIAKGAAVMAPQPDGKMKELRSGTNGFSCMPDNPASPGKDPMCVDREGMEWLQAYVSHAPKPTNKAPGLAYMLQGGSDISANEPYAKADENTKFVTSPPHWMVLWPFEPEASGLATTPKKTGTWIMWAGTPYAHLMVNQVP
jgi:hypothetical protein